MKPDKNNLETILRGSLRVFGAPSSSQLDTSRERIRERLASGEAASLDQVVRDRQGSSGGAWRWSLVAAGAVVFVVAIASANFVRDWNSIATVKTADATLYRASGEVLRAGVSIADGEVVRTNGGGTVLQLADGSAVEMRSQTEFSIDRAADGIRIHLMKGGVIVNAAKQLAGHLYVQTKEVTVSVVGTVFLVNAEEEGSRVAVIEGEVRVQQGSTTKNLLPGQQMSTSPKLEPRTVKEELAWSREAETHVALLEQAAAAGAAPPETFEVATVRPAAVTGAAGGRGAGGGRGSLRPPEEPCGDPRGDSGWANFFLQIDPSRFSANDVTLHALIGWAYHMRCEMSRGVEVFGGPSWIRTDGFDIAATIPAGSPPYTKTQFLDGEATQLQKMLQALLADRFKLILRRETREMPVYVLSVASGGTKLTPWKEGDPTTQMEMWDFLARNGKLASQEQLGFLGVSSAEFSERWAKRTIELPTLPLGLGMIRGVKAPMADLVRALQSAASGGRGAPSPNGGVRPVIDRTGLNGQFNYYVQFRTQNPVPYPEDALKEPQREYLRNRGPSAAPSLFTAVERELGLKLEEAVDRAEIWVIDRVERPSEN